LQALGLKKMNYSHQLLGYTAKDLQRYIESHPNWEKVKDTNWHLDHIFPVKAFVEKGISDVKIINSLENLQPLTQRENNIKRDNYDIAEFEAWLKKKDIVCHK
jgi:hypothetical protein